MHRKTILFVISFLMLAMPASAENTNPVRNKISNGTNLEKMEGSLANGYLAASKNDIDAAFDYFTKSLSFANKAKSWKGFIDAGYAFSALGKPKKALRPFKNAYNIAASERDWRGLVAVSYAYASLPKNMKCKKDASSALNLALKIANRKKDWLGLEEIAKAFNKFGKKDRAEKIPAPPPGWKPYGESVAGPPKISSDAQIEMRKSIDKDIDAKRRALAEAKIKQKSDYTYYITYKRYYDYPYYYNYYGYWHALNNYQIYRWANYCLSRYRLVNGVYVYIY